MSQKIKHILIISLLTLLAVITLKTFSGPIKAAIVAGLAALSAITANQWATYIAIIYGLMQIGLLIPDYIKKWKMRRKPSNDL